MLLVLRRHLYLRATEILIWNRFQARLGFQVRSLGIVLGKLLDAKLNVVQANKVHVLDASRVEQLLKYNRVVRKQSNAYMNTADPHAHAIYVSVFEGYEQVQHVLEVFASDVLFTQYDAKGWTSSKLPALSNELDVALKLANYASFACL